MKAAGRNPAQQKAGSQSAVFQAILFAVWAALDTPQRGAVGAAGLSRPGLALPAVAASRWGNGRWARGDPSIQGGGASAPTIAPTR